MSSNADIIPNWHDIRNTYMNGLYDIPPRSLKMMQATRESIKVRR